MLSETGWIANTNGARQPKIAAPLSLGPHPSDVAAKSLNPPEHSHHPEPVIGGFHHADHPFDRERILAVHRQHLVEPHHMGALQQARPGAHQTCPLHNNNLVAVGFRLDDIFLSRLAFSIQIWTQMPPERRD